MLSYEPRSASMPASEPMSPKGTKTSDKETEEKRMKHDTQEL